jgi:serpin B
MTCSIRREAGCCVLSALFAIALAGCSSESAGPTLDAAAHDTSLLRDIVVPVDSPSVALDTGPSDSGPKLDSAAHDTPSSQDVVVVADGSNDHAPDAARNDAPVADAPAIDAPSSDTISPSDAGSSPDIVTTMSAVQRIADPQVPAADSTTLASDNAAFAFSAYRQLIPTHTNLVFSPASISIALAMTYAGAATKTATEMAQALHFTLPPAQLHPAFNALDQALASRGQGFLGGDGGPMKVDITNAIWAQQTYTFRSDFLNTLAANYGAGVNLLDFITAPDPSRMTINAWVAAQTDNKIQNLLPFGVITNGTRLVLTNAVYFNAAWNTPFDPSKTQDGSFTLLDGSKVTASFMNAYLPLPAMRGTNFVAASLPCADTRLSLVVVVPDADQFSQVESSLDATALRTLMTGLTNQPVTLTLPRFQIETGTKLVELLQTLGMTSAFIPGSADFSGMDGTRTLYITHVFHDAFINVAENGTKGSGGTSVVIGSGGTGPAGPPTGLLVNANRPFVYFLRDDPTGAILFMGRVLNPSQN